jgi:hypothetical protein
MNFQEKVVPTEIFNIGIDSSYRDISKYPHAHTYVVTFDNIFKDVVAVQLVFAVYEKSGLDTYVNLQIDELSPNIISNSTYLADSFCQLPLLSPLNTYNTSMYRCIKTFEKPLSKLSKLSIKFLKPDGTAYQMRDHFLKFEIKCMKFSGSTKEWRHNEVFSEGTSLFEPKVPHTHTHQTHTNQPPHPHHLPAPPSSDPRALIRVPEVYDVDMLKTAFKSSVDVLKSQNLPRKTYDLKYKEIKEAFRVLLEGI